MQPPVRTSSATALRRHLEAGSAASMAPSATGSRVRARCPRACEHPPLEDAQRPGVFAGKCAGYKRDNATQGGGMEVERPSDAFEESSDASPGIVDEDRQELIDDDLGAEPGDPIDSAGEEPIAGSTSSSSTASTRPRSRTSGSKRSTKRAGAKRSSAKRGAKKRSTSSRKTAGAKRASSSRAKSGGRKRSTSSRTKKSGAKRSGAKKSGAKRSTSSRTSSGRRTSRAKRR
jgi:hypothetical protein